MRSATTIAVLLLLVVSATMAGAEQWTGSGEVLDMSCYARGQKGPGHRRPPASSCKFQVHIVIGGPSICGKRRTGGASFPATSILGRSTGCNAGAGQRMAEE